MPTAHCSTFAGTQDPRHKANLQKSCNLANTRQTVFQFGQTKYKKTKMKRKAAYGGCVFILRQHSATKNFIVIFALLKKLTAISFLLIFLFANTEIRQLLKLPVLIHHYLEHHDDDGGVSFADFLHKHYNEENSHPSTNNEHEKLPFKSHDLGFTQTTLVFQSPVGFELQTDKPASTKEKISYSEVFYSSSILSRIWQPPKSC